MTNTIPATVKTPDSAHTPLPYLRDATMIYALDESQTCNRISMRVEGGFVMNWRRHAERTTDEEIEATADFVHRACNSHYQLLDLIERLAEIVDDHLGGDFPEVLQEARAALSQAGGE